ncbi:MAG TPA: hypothetical protein PLD20_34895, partial [Blastocatellia bacterium]|nr:hypothetical protein [Blastocatellia bacterium]
IGGDIIRNKGVERDFHIVTSFVSILLQCCGDNARFANRELCWDFHQDNFIYLLMNRIGRCFFWRNGSGFVLG